MKNPLIYSGHFLLQNQVVYDTYQFCVGGVKYRNRLIANLGSQVTQNFLDLGCGTGAISQLLPRSINYFGVDQSRVYLEKAKRRKPDGVFSLADVCESKWVEDLKIIGSTVTSALGLFHHLSDEQVTDLLNVCKLVLNKGSFLFSVDPVITENSNSVARWFAQNDRGQFVRSPEHLVSLLTNAGFSARVSIKSNEFRIPLDTIEISAKLI